MDIEIDVGESIEDESGLPETNEDTISMIDLLESSSLLVTKNLKSKKVRVYYFLIMHMVSQLTF